MENQENQKKQSNKQTLELTLVVSKEKFTTQDGEVIDYFAFTVNILDQTFRLQAKSEDKRMVNYLLRDIFDNVKVKDNKGTKKNDDDIF